MYNAGKPIFKKTVRELLIVINHYLFTVPRSGYMSSRISLTVPLWKNIDLASILLVGLFLKDRYYLIEEGKIYAVAQTAVNTILLSRPWSAPARDNGRG
jgi:hypothetical protein